MSLRTQWERSGRWLFRYRGHLPLLLVPLLLLELFYSPVARSRIRPDWRWDLLCLSLSLAGLALRFAIVGFAPRGTSGRTRQGPGAESLSSTGFYATVRHPLYFANLLMWLGVILWPGSLHFAVIVVLAYWIYYERIMFAEEEFLRSRFGDAFEEWSRRTPAFFPRPSSWRRPATSFSVRSALKREASGWIAVVLIFPALVFLRDLAAYGRFQHRPGWGYFLVAGVAGWLVLHVLRRRGVLEVRDR
jgi:protein-S-isoprenylcysteine O-methyltransferase Ste14